MEKNIDYQDYQDNYKRYFCSLNCEQMIDIIDYLKGKSTSGEFEEICVLSPLKSRAWEGYQRGVTNTFDIEFLDEEPLENVITSLHYHMDKTIFIGFHKDIKAYEKRTTFFLEKYCHVKEIKFIEVPENDLQAIIDAFKTNNYFCLAISQHT